jgi:hypothetical protein
MVTAAKETVEARCKAAPKWSALIDDVNTPAPRQIVKVKLLKSQAGIGDDFVLARDHNSPNDVVLDDNAEVDLADGNVFYKVPRCDVRPRGQCTAPPKLAYFVNDRAEITTNPDQTGKTVRELFDLAPDATLVRDFESPDDMPIGPNHRANFRDGPVFVARPAKTEFTVIVNGRPRRVENRKLTFDEVIALAYENPPRGEFICYTITYRGGVCTKSEGMLVEGESVEIKEGMVFNVTLTDKS